MGKLLEIPIFSVEKRIISFISPARIFRIIRSQFHKHRLSKKKENKTTLSVHSNIKKGFFDKIFKKYPWKLDFSQAMGRQLVKSVKSISTTNDTSDIDIPIVLIGHSKTYNWFNKRSLDFLLEYINQNKNTYQFSLFKDNDNESFRNIK